MSRFLPACDVRNGLGGWRTLSSHYAKYNSGQVVVHLNSSAVEINFENRTNQALPRWELWTAFSKKSILSHKPSPTVPSCCTATFKNQIANSKKRPPLSQAMLPQTYSLCKPSPTGSLEGAGRNGKTREITSKSVVQQDFPSCLHSLLVQPWR